MLSLPRKAPRHYQSTTVVKSTAWAALLSLLCTFPDQEATPRGEDIHPSANPDRRLLVNPPAGSRRRRHQVANSSPGTPTPTCAAIFSAGGRDATGEEVWTDKHAAPLAASGHRSNLPHVHPGIASCRSVPNHQASGRCSGPSASKASCLLVKWLGSGAYLRGSSLLWMALSLHYRLDNGALCRRSISVVSVR